MKRISLFLLLLLISTVVYSQIYIQPYGNQISPSDMVNAWARSNQQGSEQQLKQQQIENQRLQNELLRRQLEQQNANSQQPQPNTSQGNYQNAPQNDPVFQSWLEVNPWYGRDKAKTEFSILYGKELRQSQPSLIGRPFLNAVTSKVNEVFGTSQTAQPK